MLPAEPKIISLDPVSLAVMEPWRAEPLAATVEAAALEGDRSDASLQRSSGGADASRHPRPIRGEWGSASTATRAR